MFLPPNFWNLVGKYLRFFALCSPGENIQCCAYLSTAFSSFILFVLVDNFSQHSPCSSTWHIPTYSIYNSLRSVLFLPHRDLISIQPINAFSLVEDAQKPGCVGVYMFLHFYCLYSMATKSARENTVERPFPPMSIRIA